MDISYDYRDLFRILNRHKVSYLIVGAYAVIFYTEPRYTKDIDIWVEPVAENARRLYAALKEFGAPLKGISYMDFTNKKLFYQIGIAPVRVDIIMDVAGLDFASAWKRREKSEYAGISINILGIKDLIYTKKKLGRIQDALDLKKLVASKEIEKIS